MPAELLFEKFEIQSCLKQDDYSSVYLARHIYLGKRIILKVLNTDLLPDPVVLERFKREARILARLDHPNIIKVLDFGTAGSHFYISFEYFESRNLRLVMAQDDLSLSRRSAILAGLLEALRYAHAAGIIHRDIKPENIFLDSAGNIKLGDFGLAEMNTDSLVTDKFGLVGTPGYMSPEQIRGDRLTPRSDLFSCGIVACELFLGVHPFLGRDINESLNAIVSFDEEKVFSRLAALPQDLQEVIKGLLRKKADLRWADAAAALKALGSAPVRDHPLPSPPLSRRLVFIAAIAGTVVIAVAIGWYYGPWEVKSTPPGDILPGDSSALVGTMPGSADSASRPPLDQPQEAEPDQTSPAKKNENLAAVPIIADTTVPRRIEPPVQTGELSVQCYPWARVIVDSVDLETTPLKRNLRLSAGRHELALSHPRYPVFRMPLTITPGEVTVVRVSLDTLFGFIACEVIPWGEVFVDGQFLDRTPFKPVRVVPGAHRIVVKNAEYGSEEMVVNVQRGDTTRIRHRFVSQN